MPITKPISASTKYHPTTTKTKTKTKMWMTITISLIYFLFNVAENGESEAACKLEKKEKTIRFMH